MNQKGLAPILAVLLIGITLVGAGYLVYSEKIALPQTKPVQQTTQQTPSFISDETANWKTYTNTKYGYSIKYPNAWYLWSVHPYDKGKPGDYRYAYLTESTPPNGEVIGVSNGIQITALANEKKLNSNDYIKEFVLPGEDLLHNLQNIKIKSMKLDNVDASLVEGLFAAGNSPGPVIYIAKESQVFQIWGGIENMKEGRKIFDKVISTFKFSQ